MKHQALFSLKNNEKEFRNVVCFAFGVKRNYIKIKKKTRSYSTKRSKANNLLQLAQNTIVRIISLT